MLTLWGNRRQPFCDGVSRRGFLRVGACGALSLPALLRAAAASGPSSPESSVIMVYLPGGPTQHETFDPKPLAPPEIRGSFTAASTSVPGTHFCELLPRLSQVAHLFSVVRTLTGMRDRHESYQCHTGRPGGRAEDNEPGGGWPSLGSALSSLVGSSTNGLATYVDAGPAMAYGPYNNTGLHDGTGKVSGPGFTGMAHQPFRLAGDVRADLVLNGVDPTRLAERRDLLARIAHSGAPLHSSGLDAFHEQAFNILTSSRLSEALDLTREDPAVRARYGAAQETNPAYGGAPQDPQMLLLARRLVEAGVRSVTVSFGAWDWHGTNREGTIEHHARKYLPLFDQALSALFSDLAERGLLERVSVVVWGEFGRSPRINDIGGRDHWPSTQSIVLAGGGIQGGRVLGRTDRLGGLPVERPVHVQEVFATLYRNLGIDVNQVTLPDLQGRPQYLVDEARQPIAELL